MRRETLRVGIVGCGDILTAHLRGWAEVPGAAIAGFYDVDAQAAARAQGRQAGSVVFPTVGALIEACDVVVLCSPPGVHDEAAVPALEAGRHVLIEKPVAVTWDQWQAIRAAAVASSGVLSAVYQQKYSAHARWTQSTFEAGRIGAPLSVDCTFFVEPATDPFLVAPGHWVHDLPGRRWFEVLPHLLYLIHLYAGDLQLSGVSVSTAGLAVEGAPAVSLAINLQGRYCPAVIRMSARSGLNQRELVITGTQGTLELSILNGVATVSDLGRLRRLKGVGMIGVPFLEAGAKLVTQLARDRIRHFAERRSDTTNHGRLIHAFVQAIRGEGPNPTPLDEIDSVFGACAAIGVAIEEALSDPQRRAAS